MILCGDLRLGVLKGFFNVWSINAVIKCGVGGNHWTHDTPSWPCSLLHYVAACYRMKVSTEFCGTQYSDTVSGA